MRIALIPIITGVLFSFTGIDLLSFYNYAYAVNLAKQSKEKPKKEVKPQPKPNACSIKGC